MKIRGRLINIISTRRKLFVIAAVAIVSLGVAILGLTSNEEPFSCAWPDLNELITGKPKPLVSSINNYLRLPGMSELEEAMAIEITQAEFFFIHFDPERDFVGHALPGSLRIWRYDGERWIAVNERAAMREVQRPWKWSEYAAGIYPPKMFRFAVTRISSGHACVIVEAEHRTGRSYNFYQLFRPGFAQGAWRVISEGGGGSAY